MPPAAPRSAFPEFQERLLTLAEKPNANDPFVHLLAGDAMKMAQTSEPDRLAPTGPIVGFLTSAGLAVAVLLWLILAGPGYLGYGTSLLWAGAPKAGLHPFYDIVVSPGDRTVRRKSDQLITAQLVGFDAPKVRLYAQYKGASKWEPVDMQPRLARPLTNFCSAAWPNPVEYYVEAGAVQSKHYNLKRDRSSGHQEDSRHVSLSCLERHEGGHGRRSGGDLRAVEGTEAEVAIQTDLPLEQGSAHAERRQAARL